MMLIWRQENQVFKSITGFSLGYMRISKNKKRDVEFIPAKSNNYGPLLYLTNKNSPFLPGTLSGCMHTSKMVVDQVEKQGQLSFPERAQALAAHAHSGFPRRPWRSAPAQWGAVRG